MKILALSGSLRSASTNNILLSALQRCTPEGMSIEIYKGLGFLPIFNPDMEGSETPETVLSFCAELRAADGIIISSPEYVRAIPGGLKNSIDWLVSREEIASKPIALIHASYRGDDMLDSLRSVLGTVSDRFVRDIFLRIPLNGTTPATIDSILADEQRELEIKEFLRTFMAHISGH